MAETLVAILLVTSSGKGKNVSFWWPPRPKSLARICRARPDLRAAYTAHNTDIHWRAAFSPDFDAHLSRNADEDESYEWKPPTFVRQQSPSQARSSSSGRGSPVVDRSFDRSRMGDDSVHNDGVTPLVLGYPLNALAALLAPAAICHQKFELLVDELVFIGHPVCRDSDGSWPPITSPGTLPGSSDEYKRNLEGIALTHLLHLFHLVFVLDRPDPSSASTGNLARYYDAIYRQVAFKLTAALYVEQGATGLVDNECEFLEDLKAKFLMRDPYDNAANSFNDPIDSFISAAMKSSIAVGIKRTYEAIKNKDLVDVTIGEIHVQVQLPPYLDALLHDPEDVDYPSEDDDDESNWGAESLGWRLPPFTPWKSLLLMKDGSELEIIEDLGQSGTFEGEIKSEEMLEFLDHARPDLTFHEISDLLAWGSFDKLRSIVRILVANRKAMIVDPIHPGLRASYVPVPGSTMTRKLLMEFEEHFTSEPEVPPLPAILSDISQRPRETFAAVLDVPREQGPPLQMWMNVLKWLIRRRVVVRLHTRVRIRVPAQIKEIVRKEQAVRAAELSQKRKLALAQQQQSRKPSVSAERRGRPRTREVTVSWDYTTDDDGGSSHVRADSGFGEDEEVVDDDWDEVDWHDEDDNLLPSVIPTPQKATALQRMWLEVMTRGKDQLMAERFRRLSDYLDGTSTEDEIIQINADYSIDRRAFRETLQHFKEFLIISMHP